MNMNLGTYISKKGNLVLYSRHDGGGEVHIEKDDVAEVILWLASFQQGLQPTVGILPPSEIVQPIKHGNGVEYLSTQPHSG